MTRNQVAGATGRHAARTSGQPLSSGCRCSYRGGSLEARPRNDHAAEAVLEQAQPRHRDFDPEGRVHFLNDAAMRIIREREMIQVATDAWCLPRPGPRLASMRT